MYHTMKLFSNLITMPKKKLKYKIYKLEDEKKMTSYTFLKKLWLKLLLRNHLKIKFVESKYNNISSYILVVNEKMYKIMETPIYSPQMVAYHCLLTHYDLVLEERFIFEEHSLNKLTEFY